jgi:hypothetical protein
MLSPRTNTRLVASDFNERSSDNTELVSSKQNKEQVTAHIRPEKDGNILFASFLVFMK